MLKNTGMKAIKACGQHQNQCPKCTQGPYNPSKTIKNSIPNPSQAFKETIQLYNADKFILGKNPGKSTKKVYDKDIYKIVYVGFPYSLQDEPKYKKKYKTQLKYYALNDPQKKLKTKTVFFGHKGIPDYVDDHDEQKKIVRVSLMKKVADPFSPRHYRLMFLNRFPTIEQSYMKYRQQMGIN